MFPLFLPAHPLARLAAPATCRHLRLLFGECLLQGLGENEQLKPGIRVEEQVSRHPEDLRELLVEGGHHLRLHGRLGERHQALDVLNGAERVLPKL